MPSSVSISLKMNSGVLAVAIVCHEVVLVQAARAHSSHERNVDVFVFRHFGHRSFLADPSRPRTRIPAYDLLCILPGNDAIKCPLTGMLELPKLVYGEYAECIKRHQKRVAHVWGTMPFGISLR